MPTPSGVSTERPARRRSSATASSSRCCRAGSSRSSCSSGDTAFRPRDWAFRVTPVFNLNYVHTQERNVVNVTPEEGATRRTQDLALQEAFGEVKLFDVGAELRLRLGARRHPAVQQRLPRLPVPRHQPRRARVRQLGQQPQPVERRLLRSAREGNQQRAEPARAAQPAASSSPTTTARIS